MISLLIYRILKTKTNKKTNSWLIDTENTLVVARGEEWGGDRGVGKMYEACQKVRTYGFRINKFWGYNLHHEDYSEQSCILESYLKSYH